MRFNREMLREIILSEMKLNESLQSATEAVGNAVQMYINASEGLDPRTVRGALLDQVTGALDFYLGTGENEPDEPDEPDQMYDEEYDAESGLDSRAEWP